MILFFYTKMSPDRVRAFSTEKQPRTYMTLEGSDSRYELRLEVDTEDQDLEPLSVNFENYVEKMLKQSYYVRGIQGIYRDIKGDSMIYVVKDVLKGHSPSYYKHYSRG